MRCAQPERDERQLILAARRRIRAVVLVQHAEIAVDIHICRSRCIAVRAGVHEHLAPILGEHGIGIGGSYDTRADRAALQRDLRILVRLERHADSVDIRYAVQREHGRAVCAAAESRVDTAHIVVRCIRSGGKRLSDGSGTRILHDEVEIAVDRHLRAGLQRYARDLILCAAAAPLDQEIDIVVGFVSVLLQGDTDRLRRLFDLLIEILCGYNPCSTDEIQGKSR